MIKLFDAAALLAGTLCLAAQVGAEEPPTAAKDPTIVLKISNLTDATPAGDVKKLETAVRKVKDVKGITTNKKKGEIKVTHKANADVAAIRKAVATSGFTIVDPKPPLDSDNNTPTGQPLPSAPPVAPAK
jgi:hypothetical protein